MGVRRGKGGGLALLDFGQTLNVFTVFSNKNIEMSLKNLRHIKILTLLAILFFQHLR